MKCYKQTVSLVSDSDKRTSLSHYRCARFYSARPGFLSEMWKGIKRNDFCWKRKEKTEHFRFFRRSPPRRSYKQGWSAVYWQHILDFIGWMTFCLQPSHLRPFCILSFCLKSTTDVLSNVLLHWLHDILSIAISPVAISYTVIFS